VLALLWSQLIKNPSQKKGSVTMSPGLIPRARWQGDAARALGNSYAAALNTATERDELDFDPSSTVKNITGVTTSDPSSRRVDSRNGGKRGSTTVHRERVVVKTFRRHGEETGPIDEFHLLGADHGETCPMSRIELNRDNSIFKGRLVRAL
jgi:hypothetical protein